MKTIDLRAEVTRIVRQNFPRLVAIEMAKLSGAKPIVKKQIPRKLQPGAGPWSAPKPFRQLPFTYRGALQVHGSRVKAAKAMGIAETTFRDRLKREIQIAQPLHGGDIS